MPHPNQKFVYGLWSYKTDNSAPPVLVRCYSTLELAEKEAAMRNQLTNKIQAKVQYRIECYYLD